MYFKVVEKVTMYGNNKMRIALTKNAKSQHQTKHINIQYYYICELIDEGEIIIKWIPNADIGWWFDKSTLQQDFQKVLSPTKYSREVRMIKSCSQ